MKNLVRVSFVLALVAAFFVHIRAAHHVPDWGNGMAPFAFALMGDMPYGASREAAFERLVAEVNRDNDVDFVMHAGDIKAGSEQCSNELIVARFNMYQEFRAPFVYTPGDNEWTDCHRANNGSYDPLERLAFLRTVYFPEAGETTGGTPRPVLSQAQDSGPFAEYVENVMFWKHDVLFATVHVVGSNNGLAPWNPYDLTDTCLTPRQDRTAEVARRLAAALEWLDSASAAAADSHGVFLMIQANPDNSAAPGCASGFAAFMDALRTRAKSFGRPVLLAHGDN